MEREQETKTVVLANDQKQSAAVLTEKNKLIQRLENELFEKKTSLQAVSEEKFHLSKQIEECRSKEREVSILASEDAARKQSLTLVEEN